MTTFANDTSLNASNTETSIKMLMYNVHVMVY